MKAMRKIFAVILAVTAAAALYGQNKTSYFVRNSTQSHNFNAAFVPEQGYVGFPLLSNIDLGLATNLGLSNFLYNMPDGSTGLFLNEAVSSEEFLSGLRKNNPVNLGFSYSLINAGWFTGKSSFWTLDFGIDVNVDADIPLEVFRFLKEGMSRSSTEYNINNLNLTGGAYAYASVGYSRGLDELVKGLRVGAKARFLASFSEFDINIRNMDISLSEDQWAAKSLATADYYGGLLDFWVDSDGYLDFYDIAFVLDPSRFIGGMGASFDIGAEYTISEGTPVDGLRFSLSVTDLGFIAHKADMITSAEATGEVSFSGVGNLMDPDLDVNGAMSDVTEQFLTMLDFKKKEVTGSRTTMLTATMYAGVDYSFLKDKMNVGLLYSARFGKYRTDHELTLAWNYAPSRKFDVALSYSFLKNASSIGWLLTFTPVRGIGLFVGSEYTSLNYNALNISGMRIPLPSKLFIDFDFGFTISLGGTNSRPRSYED